MHATLTDILVDVAANSIEARASRIDVSVVEADGFITLKVEDNGKGMPREILERAFDPFYTEPGKHDKRKIGMGLPFVKQTCDACDGAVKLESTTGVGTVLTCTFRSDNIDLPPMGDIPGAVLSLFNYPGDFELVFTHRSAKVDYTVARSELSDAIGGFDSVESLSLAREFLASQYP